MSKAIDVTIATRNSSRTIGNCLESIIKNVPYRKILVVDAGSTDGTVEICKSFGVEVIIETAGYLGKARYVQALNCETEWIAIIDSDVYLYPQWWREVSKHLHDEEAGLVFALHDNPISKLKIFDTFLTFFLMQNEGLNMGNTVLRRNLILECREELFRTPYGEDAVIASHAFKKGLKKITVKQRLSFHDMDQYKHYVFAHYRFGQTIRRKYGFRGPYYGGFRGIKNQVMRWCIFTAGNKQVSLRLLAYLLYLSAWTIIGFFS